MDMLNGYFECWAYQFVGGWQTKIVNIPYEQWPVHHAVVQVPVWTRSTKMSHFFKRKKTQDSQRTRKQGPPFLFLGKNVQQTISQPKVEKWSYERKLFFPHSLWYDNTKMLLWGKEIKLYEKRRTTKAKKL